MITGLTLGTIGGTIWIATHYAEGRYRLKENTATALFCVAIVLNIAATLFLLGSLGSIQ